jgi:hypothetical protein
MTIDAPNTVTPNPVTPVPGINPDGGGGGAGGGSTTPGDLFQIIIKRLQDEKKAASELLDPGTVVAGVDGVSGTSGGGSGSSSGGGSGNPKDPDIIRQQFEDALKKAKQKIGDASNFDDAATILTQFDPVIPFVKLDSLPSSLDTLLRTIENQAQNLIPGGTSSSSTGQYNDTLFGNYESTLQTGDYFVGLKYSYSLSPKNDNPLSREHGGLNYTFAFGDGTGNGFTLYSVLDFRELGYSSDLLNGLNSNEAFFIDSPQNAGEFALGIGVSQYDFIPQFNSTLPAFASNPYYAAPPFAIQGYS